MRVVQKLLLVPLISVLLLTPFVSQADESADEDFMRASLTYDSQSVTLSATQDLHVGGSGTPAGHGSGAGAVSSGVGGQSSRADGLPTPPTPALLVDSDTNPRRDGSRPSCAGADLLPCILEPEQPPTPTTPTPPGTPTTPDPATIARRAIAHLAIPDVNPHAAPQPLTPTNQPIIPVGQPIWLWTPAPTTTSTTVTQDTITVALTAHALHTTFDTGDGHTTTCTTTTPYTPRPYGSQLPATSPTCGYTYTHKNPTPDIGYTLTATTTWRITWTALNQTGTLHLQRTATLHMPVTEIWALNTPTHH